jgi:hypothetical protein
MTCSLPKQVVVEDRISGLVEGPHDTAREQTHLDELYHAEHVPERFDFFAQLVWRSRAVQEGQDDPEHFTSLSTRVSGPGRERGRKGKRATHHTLPVGGEVIQGDARQQPVHLPRRLFLRLCHRIRPCVEESLEVVL